MRYGTCAGPICGVIAAGLEYGDYKSYGSTYGERLRFAATYVTLLLLRCICKYTWLDLSSTATRTCQLHHTQAQLLVLHRTLVLITCTHAATTAPCFDTYCVLVRVWFQWWLA